MVATYRVPLGDTPWTVWREALLRTTGFPATGLDRLTALACAESADAYLEGRLERTTFLTAFERAVADCSAELRRIADEPLLREAITWQNPGMLVVLDALAAPAPPQRNRKWRYRERQLARYWQRYCAKTETIGFFGPLTWVSIDPRAPEVTVQPGPRLLDKRRVFLEPRALVAYGARIAEQRVVRLWLPPAPLPHYLLDGQVVRRPGKPDAPLTPAEAAAMARCDGRSPAAHIIMELVAQPDLGVATEGDGYAVIDGLVKRKLLRWDANLPLGPNTEAVLAERIAAIGDDDLRRQVDDGLRRLRAARDAVAAAAGDPSALAEAMANLEAEFVEVTGGERRYRQGQTYAGRGVCYEDTTRDLHVIFSTRVLDAIAPALSLALQSARWFSAELVTAYEEALQGIVREATRARGTIKLSEVWDEVVALFWGRGPGPFDDVTKRFADGWATVFRIGATDMSARRLAFTSAELADTVRSSFPAIAPGWTMARIHSPDLHICADSVDAINRGDFLAIIGELHVAQATLSDGVLNWPKPDPTCMLENALRDFGRPRMLLLMPTTWSKDTGRLVSVETVPSDWNIGFARVSSVDTHHLVPAEAILLETTGPGVVATLPTGARVPAIELFAQFLCAQAADAFKHAMSEAAHTPRVTVDNLVIFRETWRMTNKDLAGLVVDGDEPEQFLAARRLVSRYGLPERSFAKVSGEVKPMYVDFRSPPYVASFAAVVRSTSARHGGDAAVTFTEMLPTPQQTWVPDHEGNTYFGELRVQVTDPEYASTVHRWPVPSPA